jgi:hypothetical protein
MIVTIEPGHSPSTHGGKSMSTVSVGRSNITPDEVSAVLSSKLNSRYRIIPSMISKGFTKEVPAAGDAILVKGVWFNRANVRILPREAGTDIEVSPGATYFGLIRLFDRVGVANKVRRILDHASELN